jgi:hypothetical protein
MNNNGSIDHSSSAHVSLLLALLVGSLWGLSEALLGPAIRAAAVPVRAALLTGIGLAWLGFFLAMNRRPLFLIIAAFTTMATMHISVPVLQCSFLCKANSSLAILLHGVSLSAVVFVAGNKLHTRSSFRIFSGFSAPLLSGTLFFFLGMKLAPCTYLLSFNHSFGLGSFFIREILIWSLFSMVLFPAGYWAGSRFRNVFITYRERKTVLFVTGSLAAILICWIAMLFIAVSGS